MTTHVDILKAVVVVGKPFRLEELIFMPEDAQKALDLYDKLHESSKAWFMKQPMIRMIFLGRADEMVIPKSGKQIKLEKRELRRKLQDADESDTDDTESD